MKIEEVKKNLNKMVGYKGTTDIYKLTGCTLRKDKDGFFYQAELFDTKNGRSVIICRLEDAKALE